MSSGTAPDREIDWQPDVFDLPVERLREGYYTDAYFNHARSTLLADGRQPRV